VYIPTGGLNETWVNGVQVGSVGTGARTPTGLAEFVVGDQVNNGNAQGCAALAVGVGARWTAPNFAAVQAYFNAVCPP
jgi:hypothetical protein